MKINVPTNWNEVTLNEFINLSKLIYDEDNIKYYIDIINVFNKDITIEEISKWSEESIMAVTSHLSFLNTKLDTSIQKEIKIDKTTFKIINLNNITIGEYISIQTLIDTNKANSITSIPYILSIILRPEGEEFSVDKINDRVNLFLNELSIIEAMNLVMNYNNWHSIILSSYSGLFGISNSNDDEEDTKQVSGPKMDDRWRWYSIVEKLAGGDITKFDEIYKQSYINCLNLLSYWKEKNDYEESVRRRQEMMSKHY